MGEEIRKYPLVASAASYAQVGLALMSVVCAVCHGAFSTYQQIKLDYDFARTGDSGMKYDTFVRCLLVNVCAIIVVRPTSSTSTTMARGMTIVPANTLLNRYITRVA